VVATIRSTSSLELKSPATTKTCVDGLIFLISRATLSKSFLFLAVKEIAAESSPAKARASALPHPCEAPVMSIFLFTSFFINRSF